MRPRAALAMAAVLLLAGCAQAPTHTGISGADAPPDPAHDQLGWEQGYWYNESLPITTDDGLNETEMQAVVQRSMARIEYVRGLEFDRNVPVDVISRETYRNEYAGGGGSPPRSLQTFDNAKFEALFLVGENGDSLQQQSQNRGSSVLGFYSPSEDRIVVVTDGEGGVLDEKTLAHELLHAIQFRTFGDEMSTTRSTRDGVNARNGLIEGDARYTEHRYADHCGDDWQCITPAPQDGGSGGSSNFHLGIYIMKYFPYSDGPGFVAYEKQQGGWARVNDLYTQIPNSSEQVAQPRKYGTDYPTNVSLDDRADSDWERVTVKGRAPYGEVGVGGVTAMFAYPSYDDSRQGGVLDPRSFLNYQPNGKVNSSDPFNYTSPPVEGWDGDKLYVYQNGTGETAYVWRFAWDSPRDAQQFADTYRSLLRYWGGERVGDDGVWRIPEGESDFADAFYVHVDGDTVTVVNAPTRDQLDDVRSGTPTS